jgi:hypothetical protein
MSRLGKRIIKSLEQFNRDMKAGKPMKQTVVRRMTVKGKMVYVAETFVAPVRAMRKKGR